MSTLGPALRGMSDIRGLDADELDGVPASVTVSLSKLEFVIVCRQLSRVGETDPLRADAKSAFVKLIRAAQEAGK